MHVQKPHKGVQMEPETGKVFPHKARDPNKLHGFTISSGACVLAKKSILT
jgi:hypothetical protein